MTARCVEGIIEQFSFRVDLESAGGAYPGVLSHFLVAAAVAMPGAADSVAEQLAAGRNLDAPGFRATVDQDAGDVRVWQIGFTDLAVLSASPPTTESATHTTTTQATTIAPGAGGVAGTDAARENGGFRFTWKSVLATTAAFVLSGAAITYFVFFRDHWHFTRYERLRRKNHERAEYHWLKIGSPNDRAVKLRAADEAARAASAGGQSPTPAQPHAGAVSP